MLRQRTTPPPAGLALAAAFALASAFALAFAPRASADEVWPAVDLATRAPLTTALAPGDRLEVETAIAFGFAERRLAESLAIQARTAIEVRERAPGLVVVIARVEVASVRYRGPGLAFAIDRPEVGPSLDTLGAARGDRAVTPLASSDPVLEDLLARQRRVAAAAARLHGCEVEAVITPGVEPWVSVVQTSLRAEDGDLDAASESAGSARGEVAAGADGAGADEAATPASPRAGLFAPDDLVRDRLLRGLLLVAFPPVPLDLDRDDEGYVAGQARHLVLSSGPSRHPLPGEEVRVRALEPTTFARAFYAFESVTDLGVAPVALRLRADERARVHPRLGVASFREVETGTAVLLEGGREVHLRARWTALLTKARVAALGAR